MKSYVKSIAFLIFYFSLGACANLEKYNESHRLDIISRNIIDKRFIVMFGSNNYSPYLKLNNEQDFIFIDYSNNKIRDLFKSSIGNDILAQNTGKRIICDCTGVFVKKRYDKKFIIHNFRIFFELP